MDKEGAITERNIDKLIDVVDRQTYENTCLRNELEVLKHQNSLLERADYKRWRNIDPQLEAVVVATALAGIDPYVVKYFVDGHYFPPGTDDEPLYCLLSIDEAKFKSDLKSFVFHEITQEAVDELWAEIQKRIEPIGKALLELKESFLLRERYWRNFFSIRWFSPEDEED